MQFGPFPKGINYNSECLLKAFFFFSFSFAWPLSNVECMQKSFLIFFYNFECLINYNTSMVYTLNKMVADPTAKRFTLHKFMCM